MQMILFISKLHKGCQSNSKTEVTRRFFLACYVVKNTNKTSISIRLYSLMFAPFDRILIAGHILTFLGNPWTSRGILRQLNLKLALGEGVTNELSSKSLRIRASCVIV